MARKKKRRAYGELHLSQTERGVWYISGSLDGTRLRKSCRTKNRDIAEAILRDTLNAVSDEAVLGREGVTTFKDALDRYRHDKPDVPEPHYMGKIAEMLGDMRCAAIDQKTMTDVEDALFKSVSVKTRRRHLYVPVAAVIRHAHSKGVAPLPRFKVPTVSKRADKAIAWADDDWIKKFLSVIECPRLRAFVLLVTTTGLRAGEACQLRSSTVDWERREFVIKDKRGKFAKVIIPDVAYDAMLPLKGSDGRLFGFVGNGSANQAVERICLRNKLRVYTTKQFGRHAFATRLLMAGVSLKKVAVAGRWSSTQMPDMVYGHVTVEDVMDDVNKVGERFK